MTYRNSFIQLVFCLFLVFSGVNHALAYEQKSPAEKSANLQKQLNLTDEQTKKVEEIIKSQREKAEELRKQAKELREETHKKLSAVLTPEQMKKYDEMKEKRMKKTHHRDAS